MAPSTAAGHDASGRGNDRMSVGSGPTAMSRAVTTSAMRRAIGPLVDRSCQSEPCSPPDGTRPSDGFMPLRPQHDDGMRMDPPPSEPVARGTMPAAMAAAAPPTSPLGCRPGSRDCGWDRTWRCRCPLSNRARACSSSPPPRTRGTQARHEGRVLGGGSTPGEDGRSPGGDEAGRIVEVLHADGDAGQGPGVLAGGHGVVDARRRFERVVDVDGDERVHLRVERLDALQRVGDELSSAASARPHIGGHGGQSLASEVHDPHA